MSRQRKMPGSITVFFSMIASVCILLFAVLYLTEQVMVAQIKGRQALALSVSATMGGYLKPLRERYGFYAMESASVAEKDLRFFLEENLELPVERILSHPAFLLAGKGLPQDTYACSLQELELSALSYFTEKDEYERQLCDYMHLRFPVWLAQQYTDLFTDLRETRGEEEVQKEAGAAEIMEDYMETFSAFITSLEGRTAGGSRTGQGVKDFWDGDWGKEAYTSVLAERESGEIYVGALDSWADHFGQYLSIVQESLGLWDSLCQKGRSARDRLKALREETDNEETLETIDEYLAALHTGSGEDGDVRRALAENGRLLREAEEGLRLLMEEDAPDTAMEQARALFAYSDTITVPYELAPVEETRSWSSLWDSLQDYTVDLSEYVEDADQLDANLREHLPSGGSEPETEDADNARLSPSMEDALDEGREPVLTSLYQMEYLTGTFQNLQEVIARGDGENVLSLQGTVKEDGFFKAEVEYVIGGSGNEMKNCKTVRNRIVGIRMIFNAVHLLSDADKRAQIRTAASLCGGILLPGIGNTILCALITGVWALIESYCDYERLLKGQKVPLTKNAQTWRTDLESAWDQSWREDADEDEKGLTYTDYLKLLLLLMSDETVEKRTQDLMQLNLIRETGQDLHLSEMPTHIQAKIEYGANGRSYTAEEEYAY